MASNDEIEALVKGMIQTQIIQVLNNAPDVVEKLVASALSKPVDSLTGSVDGRYGSRVPYLDYIVGESIRVAARIAVEKVIQEQVPVIEAQVRAGLNSDSVTAAVVKSFVDAAAQSWRINVKFEAEKER